MSVRSKAFKVWLGLVILGIGYLAFLLLRPPRQIPFDPVLWAKPVPYTTEDTDRMAMAQAVLESFPIGTPRDEIIFALGKPDMTADKSTDVADWDLPKGSYYLGYFLAEEDDPWNDGGTYYLCFIFDRNMKLIASLKTSVYT